MDYFAPVRQTDSPEVAWVREFDPGVGGELITDRNGDVYLWYLTDSHVLKYDKRGKVLWNKRFAPPGQNSWGGILSNPKGDLYLHRRTGDTTVISRLGPNGTLQDDIRFPNTGPFAMDTNGGRMAVEFVPSEPDRFRGRQYLAKYSPTGTREWSVYLQGNCSASRCGQWS